MVVDLTPFSSGYQLTRQATDLLSFVRVLRNPKPLLLADKTLPVVEQSVYTLLHSLFGAGWKLWRQRPKDDLPLLNITVRPVLPANRWIRLSPDASHVSRPYLQCLAKHDQSSSFRSLDGQAWSQGVPHRKRRPCVHSRGTQEGSSCKIC